ncbi:uncharacterized protein LOC143193437 [Rhynchophorus ferrugineus]|uniref:uncharacterized protein LOC143193437 n=1 Tax=Rhynchophorus ferrugineus TaxID=354439 RepID=UPI003FCCE5EB
MFRYVIIAALLAMVSAAPAPEAKPDIILPVATSYVSAPAISYAYTSPFVYDGYVAAPAIYTTDYVDAYSALPAVVF